MPGTPFTPFPAPSPSPGADGASTQPQTVEAGDRIVVGDSDKVVQEVIEESDSEEELLD